jgi:pyruvate/2-oxoglutarate dehydrogenase complex dihydrolipoamide acyltransferase (E2) component
MEAPQGRSRKLAMVLLGAVIVGGGLTYAYSALLGPAADGAPPVVKGAEGPFKVKPSEPGGKQFAHTDSKIMGRLGEGGQAAPSGEVDASGARKVPVLTVGRDGSIQAPAEPEEPRNAVVVPGMVVSGMGGPPPSPRSEPAAAQPASEPTQARMTTASADAQEPVVVTPPAAQKKPETKLSAANVSGSSPAPQSLSGAADASSPSEAPKKAAPAAKKAAAVAAPAAPTVTAATEAPAAQPAPTGAGWVAVLASVPASAKSRMEALKQFADMQQKYGPLLQNKTPDIQEANLGTKGTYHRLMVGPPGSREMASELCTQLKAQGYPSCWVTAY